ncbi:MAG TPA: hydrogenase maturation nickel metallochaperone HypA [Firmicutes bacterium]|nr:hydrogenase maturation nickel metallochaperone HypA [Bacillota bacterium]
MHEIGLLKNALFKVKQEALGNGLTKIKSVDLVIGKMQGVTAESLKHALEIAQSEEPMFAGCQVQVKEIEGSMKCQDCDHLFSLQEVAESCPSCGGTNVKLISGLEFFVESYTGN